MEPLIPGVTNTCDYGGFLCGTVFELTPVKGAAWTKTVLFDFNGPGGALPGSAIGGSGPKPIFGSNGALFGTTMAGGSNDGSGVGFGGTVFELAPPTTVGGVWSETVLYSFSPYPEDPTTPLSGVLIGPSGALYGTTYTDYVAGGIPYGGSVFRLIPPAAPGGSWTESILLSLDALGDSPEAGVVSVGGSLYGTTNTIYTDGCGVVYELSPPATAGGPWTGTAIHSFEGPDGCELTAPLTVGPGGVLFGTTLAGGSGTSCEAYLGGCGTVFQLTPPAAAGGVWTENVIYSFTAANGDGAYLSAGVVLGKNGVLYGTTTYGGSATAGSPCSLFGPTGCGTVFELTPPSTPGGAWTETILYSFTGQNGEGSIPGPLTLGLGDVLYGPTETGGTAGKGTIFALKP